jgi:hypothetical protein
MLSFSNLMDITESSWYSEQVRKGSISKQNPNGANNEFR